MEEKNINYDQYREHVEELTFKKKVVEYIEVSIDPDAETKQEIIRHSFTYEERMKFRKKYEDLIEAVTVVYNDIVEYAQNIFQIRKELENDFRDVQIFEYNTTWINYLLWKCNGSENEEISKHIHSYSSPHRYISVTYNQATGKYELDFQRFEGEIHLKRENVEIFMSRIKALFMSIRSLLEETKNKDLFPKYMKKVEKIIKEYDTNLKRFSTLYEKELKKKPKKSRSEMELYILSKIEINKKRGFYFPSYADIEPDKTLLNECKKEWEKQIKESNQ